MRAQTVLILSKRLEREADLGWRIQIEYAEIPGERDWDKDDGQEDKPFSDGGRTRPVRP